MKKLLTILLLLSAWKLLAGAGPTPINFSSFNSDGSANTNQVLIQAWPPAQNTFTVYGTNVIFGGYVQTNNPNASGFFSNSVYAGTYRIFLPSFNLGFFVVVPDTTLPTSLASCTTNVPVVAGAYVGSFGLVTNYLGYWPATNSHSGIEFSWGGAIQPASTTLSNLSSGTFFALTNNAVLEIHDVLGQVLRTNLSTHTWLFIDTNQTIWINGIAVLTNSAAFDAAGAASAVSNAPIIMKTNNVLFPAQVPVFAGDVTNANGGTNLALAPVVAVGTAMKVTFDAKGRIIATNTPSPSDILVPLGFTPETNNLVPLVGVSPLNLVSSIVTNGTGNNAMVWMTIHTNSTPGPWSTNLPNGSICTSTNAMYILTNGVWGQVFP